MKITIELREQYGTVRAYPVCKTAKLMADLVLGRTLTARELATIEKLGYRIECQNGNVLSKFNTANSLNIQPAP